MSNQNNGWGHLDRPSQMVLKLQNTSAPAIFIDNQPGFVPVETISLGRRSDGVSWANTKYCMGYTVFAHDGGIGVGIIKEGDLYAIVMSRIEDFFRLSFNEEDETETSIVSVVQIDYDKFIVAAIAMYNGKAAYASATVSARGLAVALTTKIEFPIISIEEASNYEAYFSENGESTEQTTPPLSGDMIATYETYNETSGFSHVSSQRNITGRSNSAMSTIIALVQTDIKAMTLGFSEMDGATSIISTVHRENIFIVAITPTGVKVNIFEDGSFTNEEKEFKTPSCLSSFDNVYQENIFIKAPKKWAMSRYYSKIYAPPGVFFRYNTFSGIVISIPGDNLMKSYLIRPPRDGEDEKLDWSPCLDSETGKLIASDSALTNMSCAEMAYTLGGNGVFMNSGEALEDYIMAKIDNTKASREIMGGAASKAIRSISTYIPYATQRL